MKSAREIEVAMRELRALRDDALEEIEPLSTPRRALLTATLQQHYPIEATADEVAALRDSFLRPSVVWIPAAVESTLHRQLAARSATSGAGGPRFSVSRLRWPVAAAVTVFAFITATLLGVGRWEAARRPSRTTVLSARPARMGLESGMESFPRMVAVVPFNLNTSEPASLQISFFASSRRFGEGKDTPFDLRLDLPVRTALTEDDFMRIP